MKKIIQNEFGNSSYLIFYYEKRLKIFVAVVALMGFGHMWAID